MNRVRHLGELKDIAIEVLELPDDLQVRGDGRQLQSALGNLVENAVKYSEPGIERAGPRACRGATGSS